MANAKKQTKENKKITKHRNSTIFFWKKVIRVNVFNIRPQWTTSSKREKKKKKTTPNDCDSYSFANMDKSYSKKF